MGNKATTIASIPAPQAVETATTSTTSSSPRWHIPALLALIVVGLAARVGATAWQGVLADPPVRGSDSREYDRYAENLAAGRGFRGMSPDVTDPDHLTAYRPPGTSFLWAGVYLTCGHRYDAIRLLNCLFGALAIPVVYGIGHRSFGHRTGWLAALAFTFWPHSIYYSTDLVSEAPGTFFLLAFVLAGLAFSTRPSLGRAIAAGVLLGVAILVRGNPLSLVPLLVVWALIQFRGRQRLQALAVPALGLVTMLPWTLRNALVLGTFILLSTGSGDVFLGGNNRVVATDPELHGYWVFPTDLPEYRAALKAPNDEVARDRLETRLARRWVAEHLDQMPGLLWAKTVRAWNPVLSNRSPRIFRLLMLTTWGPVLLLFVAALLATTRRAFRPGYAPSVLHVTILHFVLNTLLFYGVVRFRYPIEGICLVFAALSVVWLQQRLARAWPGPMRVD